MLGATVPAAAPRELIPGAARDEDGGVRTA